jgi:hypothetical protein
LNKKRTKNKPINRLKRVVAHGCADDEPKDGVVAHGCADDEPKDGVVAHGCAVFEPKEGIIM